MYKLICMSFDGEYQTERPEFETVQEAWEYSEDLGSKWYFYPFHFVTTASGKTIADAPELLERFKGQRVRTVAREFKRVSVTPDAEGMDVDAFAFALMAA